MLRWGAGGSTVALCPRGASPGRGGVSGTCRGRRGKEVDGVCVVGGDSDLGDGGSWRSITRGARGATLQASLARAALRSFCFYL